MELEFKGKLTEIREVREGESSNGEWANVEFEVTENNPKNENYPQVALFDYFKSGEYVDMAKKFSQQHKLGDEVTVHFNLKKNTYIKDGQERSFYKTSAWKVIKESENQEQSGSNDDEDNLPF